MHGLLFGLENTESRQYFRESMLPIFGVCSLAVFLHLQATRVNILARVLLPARLGRKHFSHAVESAITWGTQLGHGLPVVCGLRLVSWRLLVVSLGSPCCLLAPGWLAVLCWDPLLGSRSGLVVVLVVAVH